MEYLNSMQIKEAVLDYIAKAPYEYALMINGEWGAGKSYLIRNELIKDIESISIDDTTDTYKVINISLFGIADTSSLFSLISSSIFYRGKFWDTKIGKTVKKVGPIVGAGLRITADLFGKSISSSDSEFTDLLAGAIQDFSDLRQYVFIIDDLERSSMPIMEVFGLFSNLIEVNSAKIIIVANEKEIKDIMSTDYQKYIGFASIADKLDLPEVKPSDNLKNLISTVGRESGRIPLNSKVLMDAEKLKLQVDRLFPPDENYRRYKEKVIGKTITYCPELEACVEPLIEEIFSRMQYNYKESQYVINDMPKIICKAFKLKDYHNIRAIQMLISYLGLLLPRALPIVKGKFGQEDPYVLNEIVYGIANTAIMYSRGVAYKDIDTQSSEQGIYTYDSNRGYLSFRFAADYFYYGVYDDSNMRNIITMITDNMWRDCSNPNNPINKLTQFYLLDEEEVNATCQELMNEFYYDKYNVTDYPLILRNLLDVSDIGLISKNLVDKIVEKMCENVKGNHVPFLKVELVILPQSPELADIYREYLERIINSSKGGENHPLKDEISKALLNHKLYSSGMKAIYNDKKFNSNDQTSYFLLTDLPKVISVIKESSARDIMEFRIIITLIYDDVTNCPKSETAIRDFIKLLSNALEKEKTEFYDRIAILQATWLKNNLDTILLKYPMNNDN